MRGSLFFYPCSCAGTSLHICTLTNLQLHYHAERGNEEEREVERRNEVGAAALPCRALVRGSVKARRYAQKRSTPRWPPCSCVGAGTSLSGLVFRRGYTDGILHKLNLQLHYHAERGNERSRGGTRKLHYHAERGNEMRATAARERGAAQAWITRILSLSPIAENTQWMILSKTKNSIAEG